MWRHFTLLGCLEWQKSHTFLRCTVVFVTNMDLRRTEVPHIWQMKSCMRVDPCRWSKSEQGHQPICSNLLENIKILKLQRTFQNDSDESYFVPFSVFQHKTKNNSLHAKNENIFSSFWYTHINKSAQRAKYMNIKEAVAEHSGQWYSLGTKDRWSHKYGMADCWYHFLRDRKHSPWLCQGPWCRLKGLHQVYALWAWDTEDLHALVQTTPAECSYSESEAPPSWQRSDKSSCLQRDRNTEKEKVGYQLLQSDVTGKRPKLGLVIPVWKKVLVFGELF